MICAYDLQRVQLDNQMMEATQPVVLAPAASTRTGKTATESPPLVRFGITRSFANAVTASIAGPVDGLAR